MGVKPMDNEKFQELVLKQLQGLIEGQKELEQGQKSLIKEQKGIRKDLTKLETRMENEVIDKIRALFDDRSVNQDYFASIKDSLARIEDRVDFLARQNVEHLSKLQEHDRELRLLRAEKKL